MVTIVVSTVIGLTILSPITYFLFGAKIANITITLWVISILIYLVLYSKRSRK